MTSLSGASSAAEVWAAEQSALLRGIAHALSNRVGTIVSAVGMLTPGAPASAPIVSVLADEGARLEDLLTVVRLLAGDGVGATPEPIHVPDLIGPIVALHAHHPDARDIECLIDASPVDVPAFGVPGAIARSLLVLLTSAKRDGEQARVGCVATPTALVVTVDGSAGDIAAASTAEALLGDDGEVRATATGYAIALKRFG